MILASASPRRAKILSDAGISFSQKPVKHEEHVDSLFAAALEKHAPLEAAQAVVEAVATAKYQKARENFGTAELILTADTIVYLDSVIYGKPRGRDEALSMLKALADKTHQVMTAVCAGRGNHYESLVVRSDVSFYPIDVNPKMLDGMRDMLSLCILVILTIMLIYQH